MTSQSRFYRTTQSVNILLDDIIIFPTTQTFLQDLHIVRYMILLFTNRLSSIKVSENRTGEKFYQILTISGARMRSGRCSAKVEKGGPYHVIRTGY